MTCISALASRTLRTQHVRCCCLPWQGVLDFKGGETAALERLQYYLFDSHLIATYFDSRNGMLGAPAGCSGVANAFFLCHSYSDQPS